MCLHNDFLIVKVIISSEYLYAFLAIPVYTRVPKYCCQSNVTMY